MNIGKMVKTISIILMVIAPVQSVIAAEEMPDDPLLPQNNVPTNKRQNQNVNPGTSNNNQPPTQHLNNSSSTNTSTGINVGPGGRITPQNGTQNGTLTGNGAGVGPDSTGTYPSGR